MFGRLPLAVVEIRRDGDDRALDRAIERGFSIGCELFQDERRQLLGRESALGLVVAEHDLLVGSHPLFDRVNRPLGVLSGLVRGFTTNGCGSSVERDHGGGQPVTVLVREDIEFVGLGDRDRAVGRSEVNADAGFGHG